MMDEVRIWAVARTEEEIRHGMSCPLSDAEPGLAGYWNFDGGNAADLTGHGHDGSLTDGASVEPQVGEDVIHAGCGRLRFTEMFLTAEQLPFLTLTGKTGMVYRIDVSSNLVDWVPWVTLPNQDGDLQVIDPGGRIILVGSIGPRGAESNAVVRPGGLPITVCA